MPIERRTFLKYGLYCGSGALAGSICLAGCSRKHPISSVRNRPNVVVVLCDTLRPDYLGFNGYPGKTSPFLTELSKSSINFKRAFATSSWTAPSTSSLFTSMYPHRHGVIEGFMCHKKRMAEFKKKGKVLINLNRIPSDIPTMPELLQSAGYLTLGIAANINIGSAMGFDRGFDRFELFNDHTRASTLYRCVKGWINEVSPSKKPVFLYTHFNDPHYPYVKHYLHYEKPVDKKYEPRARYLSEIRYLDKYIEKLYDFMGADSNTIFVVVSDHGEEFWDHGKVGHKSGLHRELTNVLTMFHAPFLGIRPASININISLIDVLPTILELISFKKVSGMEGLSLVPILKSDGRSTSLKERLNDRTIFAHRMLNDPQTQFWAAINRHWNMIELPDSKKVLFDHRNDLPERQDVFSDNPGITGRLTKKLEYFKSHGSRVGIETTPVDMDKDLLEELESLGYVDR
ncbi:MAG: hypothetical protein DRP65_04500 [Planctomycetota bacterium]|nr:MAG: hypothetical protein DRP65_04500 [Planctomycetota bacterium]